MATQYVLVKRDYMTALLESRRSKEIGKSPGAEPMAVTATSLPLQTGDGEVEKAVEDLLTLLPKLYRARAKALLKILSPDLRLSPSNILSFKPSYNSEFENLYDLIFWLYTTGPVSGHIKRPTNAFQFITVLVERKVPQRLLATKEAYVRNVIRVEKKRRGE